MSSSKAKPYDATGRGGEKATSASTEKQLSLKQDAATGSQSTTRPSRLRQEVNSTIN